MEFIYPELAAEFYTVVLQVKAGQDRATAFKLPCAALELRTQKSLSSRP